MPAGFTFTPSSTSNSALPGGVVGVYGTRAIGQSGNPLVVSTTLSTAGAMGYADIGEVINQGAGYALVNKFDPAFFGLNASNVPTPISISPTNVYSGKVLDGALVNAVLASNSHGRSTTACAW